jgi:hypothetical protein
LKKYTNVIATVTATVAVIGGIIGFLAWYTGREQGKYQVDVAWPNPYIS